jgi:hypothetical protein
METSPNQTITPKSLIEIVSTIGAMRRDHKNEMPIEDWMAFVDRQEKSMAGGDIIDLETKHRKVGDIYVREVRMLKGQIIISNIHNTEHPFVIFEGSVTVRTHKGISTLKAPHFGVTYPMTRRIIHCEEDCRWATFHTMLRPDETVDEIMDRILYKRRNPLLSVTELARIENKVRQTNQLN